MPEPQPSPESLAHANFIATCLAWQESLLQAYRGHLLFTQSIFLAVDVGLLSAQAATTGIAPKLVFALPLFMVATIGGLTLGFLTSALRERASAVDWWQRRLLRHERNFPELQTFTTYRVAKEHGFKRPAVEARVLEEEEIERLLRQETPRGRKVFLVFVPGFAILWLVLVGCAVLDMLLR